MKSLVVLIALFLNLYVVLGQTIDSVATESSLSGNHLSEEQARSYGSQNNQLAFRSEKQKKVLSRGNLSITFYGLRLSPIESEISDLESRECTALLKRDTATLIALWSRDFTLDEPTTGLVTGKNPLPYYVSFGRMIEKFSVWDNVVFTSGYESFQQLQPNGKLGATVKRNYSHTWTKKYGLWKLTTKIHD